jgi:hypothetical protein
MKNKDDKKPKVIEHFDSTKTFGYLCVIFVCILLLLSAIRASSGAGVFQGIIIFDALSQVIPFILQFVFAIATGGSNMGGGTPKFFSIGE